MSGDAIFGTSVILGYGGGMSQDKRRKLADERLPPYVGYRQWQKLLDDLAGFVPSRIDATYFDDMHISGSSRSMLRGALLFLGLISDNGSPGKELKELVTCSADAKPKILEGIVRRAYAPLFADLDLAHSSPGQVKEYFDSQGIKGDIGRKCLSFLRAIAADAQMELSPRIERSSRGRKVDKPRVEDIPRHREFSAEPRDTAWVRALIDKFPSFDPQWPDPLKLKWFEDFNTLSQLDKAVVERGLRSKKT